MISKCSIKCPVRQVHAGTEGILERSWMVLRKGGLYSVMLLHGGPASCQRWRNAQGGLTGHTMTDFR
ncbi:hypothetical protein M404DRAFT_611049 [Pisolithus tinctorius Marx 270]|uniref:Uncharacterized protein n=1 Tax=Pisolithus tinctorius Marx 270 TaxID=870435 RepID=A0A0C3P7I2_PISTI|nr:hypothetical protein M404DRAFT_611049 [Pisolithus tinctorius Marx 270]